MKRLLAESKSSIEQRIQGPRRGTILIQQPAWALQKGLNRLRTTFDAWTTRYCRRSGFLASVYYAMFSRSFRREHRAVLEGRHRYARDVARPSETSALLRRNTHRLEKGLLMRPRRDLFAVDYIDSTVQCYEQLVKSARESEDADSECQWASDVLYEYFAVTSRDPRTEAARARFEAINRRRTSETKLIPYCRNLAGDPPVSYVDLLALARRRRSVRWFTNQEVPRQAIDHAIELAAQSPSACNRQPFHFRIFDEPSLVRQVADIPGGTPGFAHNIPVIAVIVGQLRCYPYERDRHLIYIDGSLAAMSFILALESQGLSSCCINWPDVEDRERRMAALLRLAPDERPVMCVALGYPDPDGLVAYSQKKPLSQIRRYNQDPVQR